jgi:hypothetical protein
MSNRTAEGMCIAVLVSPLLSALSIQDERHGVPVPGLRGLLAPSADLGRALRLLGSSRLTP